MAEEKRRFSRIPFRMNTQIMANDTLYSTEEITNLSIGGCLLQIPADLKLGTACHVKIWLKGTSDELSVKIDGKIIRSVPGFVAVKFARIDLDSLFHLQNIIRYNAPNPDIIDQEIHQHQGIV